MYSRVLGGTSNRGHSGHLVGFDVRAGSKLGSYSRLFKVVRRL